MKFCEKCKKVYDNSVSFCPYCAANLIDVEKDSQFCNLNKDTTLKNNHVNSNNSTNEIEKKKQTLDQFQALYLLFFLHY